MEIRKVLLLGGSGFVGGYIARRLAACGVQVTIPARRPERCRELILLPQVDLVQADIHCPQTLDRLVSRQDAVINLVGILHSRDVRFPYSRDFARAHVELPQKIVAACKAAGVRRLLHMSALKADPAGPSEYLASKGAGEKVVRDAQGELDVTVFRPSVIFGQGDAFLAAFARILRMSPLFPLGFGRARFQPVWVGDVAEAFVASLRDEATFGQAYDLCGPRCYTLRELVEYVAGLCGSRARIVPLCEGLAYLQAGLMWLAPKPMLSPDNLRSLQVDSVCDAACHPFPDWQPAALETVAPTYIALSVPRRRYDRYRFRAGR